MCLHQQLPFFFLLFAGFLFVFIATNRRSRLFLPPFIYFRPLRLFLWGVFFFFFVSFSTSLFFFVSPFFTHALPPTFWYLSVFLLLYDVCWGVGEGTFHCPKIYALFLFFFVFFFFFEKCSSAHTLKFSILVDSSQNKLIYASPPLSLINPTHSPPPRTPPLCLSVDNMWTRTTHNKKGLLI